MLHFKLLLLGLLTLSAGHSGLRYPQKDSAVPEAQPVKADSANTSQATTAHSKSLVALNQPVQAANLPLVTSRDRYYSITGMTVSELRSQMSRRGPIDSLEGQRYDAKTEWSVHWSYSYTRAGSRCAISGLSTRIELSTTYPQWATPSGTPYAVIAEWQRYMTALQLHEDGHRNNGVAAGRDISSALSRLPAYASCQELDRVANATAQSVIRYYNQQDIDYDRTTHHGYLQGAVFPVNAMASQ